MSLSSRGIEAAQPSGSMLLWKIIQDLWDPQNNPDGYVSLGIAENTLMHDALSQHLHTHINLSNHAFTYGDGPTGTKRLKAIMSRFFTKYLQPFFPIENSHLTVTNGCTASLEHLSFSLANPGDAFLLGQPYYGAFNHDLTLRSETFLAKVAFGEVDPFSLDAVQMYEQALIASQRSGRNVAGLVLCNPHNPLGRCYPRATLIELMRLCEKHQIHFISDEVYALSTWSNTVDSHPPPAPFESCLSIDPTGLIDPSRVHLIWGTSKDFGANGIRLGVIISQSNPSLHAALVPVALYSSASSIADHVVANILEDDEWVAAYIDENRRRLSEHHALVTTWAKQHQIRYAQGANAGFFSWVDLGSAWQALHPERPLADVSTEIMDTLLKHKVFLASGVQFGSEEPGWFRIVFSHQKDLLEEGLKRIEQALYGDDHSAKVLV